MKSTRTDAYIDESPTVDPTRGFGVPQPDAIHAATLFALYNRHRRDLRFLEEMLDLFDSGQTAYLRQSIVDWRDELERQVADLKRELYA